MAELRNVARKKTAVAVLPVVDLSAESAFFCGRCNTGEENKCNNETINCFLRGGGLNGTFRAQVEPKKIGLSIFPSAVACLRDV